MRRGLVWAIVGAGAVLGLAAGSIALIANRDVSTALARDALARLDEQIPADIRFAHLSVRPFSGLIAVDDVAVTLPGKPGERLASARQVLLDLDMAALLRGKVRITRIHLVNPEVTVIHRGGDRYNLQELIPQPTRDEPQPGGSAVALERITLEGGRLTYMDGPRKLAAELPHLDASLDVDLPAKRYGGQVTLARGWVRHEGFKHPIDSFRVDAKLDGPRLQLAELKLDAGRTGLALRGEVQGIGTDDVRLALDGMAKTDLAGYAALPALEPHGVAGRLAADFRVEGPARDPRAAVRLTGEALRARAIAVPRLTAAFTATREAVAIERAEARLWGGRVTAKGTAPLAPTGKLDAEVAAEGVDLAAAARALKLKGDAARVKGTLAGAIAAKGQGRDPRRYQAAGWLRAAGSAPVRGRDLPLTARADLTWAAGALEASRIAIQALGGQLTGAGRLAPLAEPPTYAFRGDVAGLDLGAVERAIQVELPVTGRAGGHLDLRGTGFEAPRLAGGATAHLDGTLKRDAGGNEVPVPFVADATVDLAGRDLSIRRLTARALGGTATATGRVPLDGRRERLAIAVDARGLDVAAVERAYPFAPGPIAGRADARVRLAGTRLDVDHVLARVLGGTVTTRGHVAMNGKPRYDLRVAATGMDLEPARRAFRLEAGPLDGEAHATLHVTGQGPRFRATGPVRVAGRMKLPDPVVPGATRVLPLAAQGDLAVAGKALAFHPLTARLGGSTLLAQGSLDLAGRSDLTFKGQVAEADALARLFGLPPVSGGAATFSGWARGPAGALRFEANAQLGKTRVGRVAIGGADLTAKGTYDRQLAVQGRLTAKDVVSPAVAVATIDAPFTYRAKASAPARGTLRLPALDARLGGGRVAGQAMLDLGARAYEAAVRSEGLTLGALVDIPLAEARAEGMPVEEMPVLPPETPVGLSFTGKGTLAVPKGELVAEAGGFTYADIVYGPTRVRAALDGRALALDGKAFGDRARIAGRVPIGKGEARIDVALADARLAPVLALSPKSLRTLVQIPTDGRMTGTIHVAGPVDRPRDMRVAIDMADLAVLYPDLVLANKGRVKVRLAGRRMAFDAFRLAGGGSDVRMSGELGLGVSSDLVVQGAIDLALLEKVAPKEFADARGKAVIDGRLRGTVGSPDLNGALTVRDADLTTRNLPQPVRDLNATVRLTRDKAFLDQLRATLGYTGKIQAFGGATLDDGFQPTAVNLQVDAREVALRMPGAEVVANAELSWAGRPGGGRLDGQVKVLEGTYDRDVELTGGLAARRSGNVARAGATAMAHPLVRDLGLRVQVLVPDRFRVRNNLLDAEVRGDLLVLGTPNKPVVVGRAEALEGKVHFQDRTYVLEEATVDFIDPAKLTPYMHVVATSTIQAVAVRVQANGTPEQLKLDLASTPAMSQTDILALIATGQTPQQLQESGGGGLATASNLLLNQVAGGVARGIADRGVVDVLSIRPGSTDPAQPGGGSFTVGKRLNEKLTITYTQDIAAPPGRTPGRVMIFDYLLTDAVVLKLEQDFGGGFNASARYRIPIR